MDLLVDSSSNRHEDQKYFLGGKGNRGLGLTTLPPLCAYGHEIWELQPPETFRACPDLYRYCFSLIYTYWVRSWLGCRGVLDKIVMKNIPVTTGD